MSTINKALTSFATFAKRSKVPYVTKVDAVLRLPIGDELLHDLDRIWANKIAVRVS